MTSSARKRLLTEVEPPVESTPQDESHYSESSKRSRHANWPLPEYSPTPPRPTRAPKQTRPSSANQSPPISAQAIPPGEVGASAAGRSSKFAEESMHDRPSQRPDSVFLRHDALPPAKDRTNMNTERLIEEYDEERGRPRTRHGDKPTGRKKLQPKSPRNVAHGVEPPIGVDRKKGGFFRFGNPWNLPRFIKETWRSSKDALEAEGRQRLENDTKEPEAAAEMATPYRQSRFSNTAVDVSNTPDYLDDAMETEDPVDTPRPGFFKRMISTSNLRHARSEAQLRPAKPEDATIPLSTNDDLSATPVAKIAPLDRKRQTPTTADTHKRIRKLRKRKEHLDKETDDTIQTAHGFQTVLGGSPSKQQNPLPSLKHDSLDLLEPPAVEPLLHPDQLGEKNVVESIETGHAPGPPSRSPPPPPSEKDKPARSPDHSPTRHGRRGRSSGIPKPQSSAASSIPLPLTKDNGGSAVKFALPHETNNAEPNAEFPIEAQHTQPPGQSHLPAASGIPRSRRQPSQPPVPPSAPKANDIPVMVTPDDANEIPPVPSIPPKLRSSSAGAPSTGGSRRLRRTHRSVSVASKSSHGERNTLKKPRPADKENDWVDDGMGGQRRKAACDEPGWEFPADVF